MASCKKRGYILYLVSIIVLSITILFTILYKSVGHYYLLYSRYQRTFQDFYKSESALVLFLKGYPNGYFGDLPHIKEENLGPWKKICTNEKNEYCLTLGTKYREITFSDLAKGVNTYKTEFYERLTSRGLKNLNGNRRFFKGEKVMEGMIHQGDLELNFPDSVHQLEFFVDGNVLIKDGIFDTLRVYALGDVNLLGNTIAHYLEIYAGENFKAEGNVSFKGFVLSSKFMIKDNVRGNYPSVLIALGKGLPKGEILGRSKISGATLALNGFLNIEDTSLVKQNILPSFLEDSWEVFF